MSGTTSDPFGPIERIEIARDSASLRATSRCPLCGTATVPTAHTAANEEHNCWRCQLDLTDPRLAEVFQLGVDAADLLDQREAQLWQLRRESITKQEQARAALETPPPPAIVGTTVSAPAIPAPPAPSAPATPAAVSVPLPPLPEPAPTFSAAQEATPFPTEAPRVRRHLSPQAMLLIVGVSFVAIAAVVFLTVAFVVFNLATKSAIVGGLTALSAIGATLLQRTKLGRTAEAIAALAVIMCVLDLWALDALGMFASASLNSALIWGLGLGLFSVAWWAWGHTTRLRAATIASSCSIVPALSLLTVGFGNQLRWDTAALVIPLSLTATSAFAVTSVFHRGGKPLRAEQHILQATATLTATTVMIFLLSAASMTQIAAGYGAVAAAILTATWFVVTLRWGATDLYRAIAALASVVAAFALVLTAQVVTSGAASELPWWCGGVLIAVAGCWGLLRTFGNLQLAVTIGATASAVAAAGTLTAHFAWAINRFDYLSPARTAERYLGTSTVDYWAFDLALLIFAVSSATVALIIVVLLQRLPVGALAPRATKDMNESANTDAGPHPVSLTLPRVLAEMSIRHLASIVFAGVAITLLALALMALPAAPALAIFGLATLAGVIAALRLPPTTNRLLRYTIELGWALTALATLVLAPVATVPLLVVAAVFVAVLVRTVPLLATRAAHLMPIAFGMLLVPLTTHTVIAALSLQQLWPTTVLFAVLCVPAALLHLSKRRMPSASARLILAVLACFSAAFSVLVSWPLTTEPLTNGLLRRAAATLNLPTAAAVPIYEQLPIMCVLVVLLVVHLLLLALVPTGHEVPVQFTRLLAIPLAAAAVVISADGPLTLVFGFSTASHVIVTLGLSGLLAAGALLISRNTPATAKLGPAVLVVLSQTIVVLAVMLTGSALRNQPEIIVGTTAAILATAGISLCLHHPTRVSPAAQVALWLVPTFIACGIGALVHAVLHNPLPTVLPGIVAFTVASALLVIRRPSPTRSWTAAWLALGVLATWQIALVTTPTGTRGLTAVELGTLGMLATILIMAAAANWSRRLVPLQVVAVLIGPALTAASFVLLHSRFHASAAFDSLPVPALLIELGLVCALTLLFGLVTLCGAQRGQLAAFWPGPGVSFAAAALVLMVPVVTTWLPSDTGFALPLLAAALGTLLALQFGPKPPPEPATLAKLRHSPALTHYVAVASVLVFTGLSFFALNGRNFEIATAVNSATIATALLYATIAALSLAAVRRGHRFAAVTVPLAIWLCTAQFSVPLVASWWPFITAIAVAFATVVIIRLQHRSAEPPLPARLTASFAAAIPGAAAAIPQLTQPMATSSGVFAAAALGLLALSLWPSPNRTPVNPARVVLVCIAAVAAVGMRQNAPTAWAELSALPLGLLLARTAVGAAQTGARREAQVYALLAPVSFAVLLASFAGGIEHPVAVMVAATGLAFIAVLTARQARDGDTATVAASRSELLQAFSVGAITATVISQLAVMLQAQTEHVPTLLLLLVPSLALLMATSFVSQQVWLATAAAFGAQLLPLIAYSHAPTAGLGAHYALMVPLTALAAAPIIALAAKSPSRLRNGAMIAVGAVMLHAVVIGTSVITPAEAVTVPVAAAALTAGMIVLANTPNARSWVALGPGLVLLLVVGYLIEHVETEPWRVALMTLLIAGTLVFGAIKRLQAPIVLGTVTGLAHALLATRRTFPELVVPWWVWLAIVGAALIFVAATYEARRRQARALFASVSALR